MLRPTMSEKKADVWSLGMTLFQLFNAGTQLWWKPNQYTKKAERPWHTLFTTHQEEWREIVDQRLSEGIRNPELRKLLRGALAVDPTQRPSAERMLVDLAKIMKSAVAKELWWKCNCFLGCTTNEMRNRWRWLEKEQGKLQAIIDGEGSVASVANFDFEPRPSYFD